MAAFHGAFSVLVFLITIIGQYALAKGARVKVPGARWKVKINSCVVPWIATAVLIVFQAITFQDAWSSVVGRNTPLRPICAISVYLCLAYLSGSCEITGLYSWLALLAARRTRSKPLLLLATIFGLSGALAAITSADVSLIVLTPVLVYTAASTCLDPIALLGSVCVGGVLSPVAGLSNIIAVQAFGFTFIRFLTWMLLPTLAAAGVVFGLLYLLLHRRRLRHRGMAAAAPFPDPGILLHDQVGAALCSAALCCCLLALAVGPSLRWADWAVAAVFAGLAALYNAAASAGPLRGVIGRRGGYERRRRLQAEMVKQGLQPALSDEDLADLLLSAAHQRQASLTRLAAATATSVAASAATTTTAAAAASTLSRGGAAATATPAPAGAALQRQQSGSGRRSSGWGMLLAARPSSSSSLASGSTSLVSVPSGSASASAGNTDASTSGGGGARASGGGGGGGAPWRRAWFSRQWSGARGRPVTPALGAELLAAASAAGSDLGILAACAAVGLGGSASAVGGGANWAALAPPPQTGWHWGAGAPSGSGGAGQAPSAAAAVRGGISVEFQQLLAQGTGAAPDRSDWWAAAAQGAEELLRSRGLAADWAAAPPQLPLAGAVWLRRDGGASGAAGGMCGGEWSGEGIAAIGGADDDDADVPLLSPDARTAGQGGRTRGGGGGAGFVNGCALTRESPFAAASAMYGSGWDGRFESAAAVPWVSFNVTHANHGGATPRKDPAPPAAAQGTCDAGAASAGSPWFRSPGGRTAQAGHAARLGRCNSAAGPGAPHHSRRGSEAEAAGPGWPWQSSAGPAPGAAGCGGRGDGPAEHEAPDTWGADRGGAGGCTADLLRCKSGAEGRRQSARTTPRSAPPRGGSNTGDGGAAAAAVVLSSAAGAGPPDRARTPDQRPGRPASERGHLPSPPSAPSQLSQLQVQPLSPRRSPLHCDGDDSHWGGRSGWDTGADTRGPSGRASPSPPPPPPPPPEGNVTGGSDVDGEGNSGPGLPSQPRRTRSSTAGLESLFGCWLLPPRQQEAAAGDADEESAALLPPRVAASDDPRHHCAGTGAASRQGSCQLHAGGGAVAPSEAAAWGSQSAPQRGGGCAAERRLSAAGPAAWPPAVPAVGSAPSVVVMTDGGEAGGLGCGGGCVQAARGGAPSLDLLLFGPSEISFLGTFTSLPWAPVVQLLGMCVLVEALQVHGWLDSLSLALESMASAGDPVHGHERSAAHSGAAAAASPAAAAASAVFAVGWLAAGLSVTMTGQNAVLLLARAMTRPEFLTGSSAGGAAAAARRGAQLALVAAAGLAPAVALTGSLTALRWGLGLRRLGVRLRCCRQLGSALAPAAVAGTMAALLVLWAQCAVSL